MVEEELDIRGALKLVKQSVVESTPINSINCLYPCGQPYTLSVKPMCHAMYDMQVKVKCILGRGRHRPVRPHTAARALGRGSFART